jgi:hypothetical protein
VFTDETSNLLANRPHINAGSTHTQNSCDEFFVRESRRAFLSQLLTRTPVLWHIFDRFHLFRKSRVGQRKSLNPIYPVTWPAVQVRYSYDNQSFAVNAVDQSVRKPR